MTIIPATEGYVWLAPHFTDEGPFVDRMPIIAWSIDEDGSSRPVLAAGASPSRRGALLLPDGQVVWPNDEDMRWDTEAEWLEWASCHSWGRAA
jgi:hypothetical protein